jgi:hypothetical protein
MHYHHIEVKCFAQNFKKKKLEIFFYKYNLFVLGGGGEGGGVYTNFTKKINKLQQKIMAI